MKEKNKDLPLQQQSSEEELNEKQDHLLYTALFPNDLISKSMIDKNESIFQETFHLLDCIKDSRNSFTNEIDNLEKDLMSMIKDENEVKVSRMNNKMEINENDKIKKLYHENDLLCNRIKGNLKIQKNLEIELKNKDKEKLQIERKCSELMNQLKSLYNSLSTTQAHVETIINENTKLTKKLEEKNGENERKLEEYRFKLKAEVSIRKAAEKDTIEARERIHLLEKKVLQTQIETNELKDIVDELKSSNGLLHTIAKIRNNNEHGQKVVGFDSLIKKIEKVSKK